MYGKIFESMYEGSLYGRWEALVTMQQLIVLANEDGIVDMTPPAIAGKTSIPLDIIEKGIKILEAPDPYSRTPGSDGVRIELLDDHRPWGWHIVNYQKYRDIVRREDKRRADRERLAKKRKSLNGNGCRKVSQSVANVAHTDTDTNTDTDTGTSKHTVASLPEFDDLKRIYPKRAGSSNWKKAQGACNARLKAGHTWDEILDGAKRYASFCEATDITGTQFVKQAATFCGPELHFLEPWEPPPNKGERLVGKNVSETLEWMGDSNGSH